MRRPIGDDVLEQAGEVVLARNAVPADDPELVLRVAEAAPRGTVAGLDAWQASAGAVLGRPVPPVNVPSGP